MKRFRMFLALTILSSLVWGMDLTTWKKHYGHGDDVWIQLHDKPGNREDWIGIYHKGDTVAWKNVIDWRWAKDNSPTQVDPGDWYKFNLKDGSYEARFFLNNSYKIEKKVGFTVGKEEYSKPNVCNDTNINSDKPCTVSTFHNISLYWSPKNNKGKDVEVFYRKADNDTLWDDAYRAMPLKCRQIKSVKAYSDKGGKSINKGEVVSKGDCRGSIVNLEANTKYEIKLKLDGVEKTVSASTWDESFGDPQVYTIKEGVCSEDDPRKSKKCTVKRSGSAEEGYIVIDGKGDTFKNIVIKNRSYVIIRNFVLKGAQKHAIYLEKAHHIVIEDCDISNWGQKSGGYARERDSAIYGETDIYSSVFQRNKIHDPHCDANTWAEKNTKNPQSSIYHPRGAQGITLNYCYMGNNVIRYNEFYLDKTSNFFDDAMGGSKNASYHGFPGADSDIYGNYVSGANDDGIEVEGGGQNVRVWHNYIEHTHTAIANAVTSIGPLYIWRNVSGKSLTFDTSKSGKRPHGAFLKMGATRDYYKMMTGQIYVFNNTMLNTDDQNEQGYGGIGSAGKSREGMSMRPMAYLMTRNNILDARADSYSISTKTGEKKGNRLNTLDLDYDLATRDVSKVYKDHLFKEDPVYDHSTKIDGDRRGDFGLSSDRRGVCIDNIIPYAEPVLGAQSDNVTSMEFGVRYTFVPPSLKVCEK